MRKENTKEKAKNSLLRAYLSSLLSLVLCVCMFCGTSYAWFTSEVVVENNEIYVGMLDVDLLMDDQSLKNSSQKIYDGSIAWEPGYTVLRTLQVKNTGNLAFSYVLNFTDATAAIETEQIAKWFSVYVTDQTVTATSFDAIKNSDEWTCVGTLQQVLSGEPVFTGSMLGTEQALHTYTVALHMEESATGEGIMGQRLNLNVKLTAYQKAAEEDLFGKDYDNLIRSAEELKAAFAQGGKAVLLADVAMEQEKLNLQAGKTLTLDLNGHDITGQSLGTQDALIHIQNGATLNVQDTSPAADGVIKQLVAADGDSTTIHCEGQLNLYSGTLAQTQGGDVTVTVDVQPNAWSGAYQYPTQFHMYGGKVDGADTHAIRLAVNSSETYTDAAAACIIDGGQITGYDGVMVQTLNSTYRPVDLQVNGGTITATNAAIRVFGPAPAGYVSTDATPIHITLTGGTFTSGSADASPSWMEGGIIKVQNTDNADDVSVIRSLMAIENTIS